MKKPKTIYDISSALWFSGFCLTDTYNFAEFNLIRIPKLGIDFKKFRFSKEDLIYDKSTEINIKSFKYVKNLVIYNDYMVHKVYFDYFVNKYSNVSFWELKTFMNKSSNNKTIRVGVFKNEELVGLLMMRKCKQAVDVKIKIQTNENEGETK